MTTGHRPLPRWKLVASRTPTSELDARDWAELESFFGRSYEIDMERFREGLRSRTDLVRIRERGAGRLVGTTSFSLATVTSPTGRAVRVFYGGDALLLPETRGTGLIQEMAVRIVLGELLRHPRTPHYGFGVALTHLMYVGLVRSFPGCWPRHDCETPPEQRFVMEELGRRLYPQTWRGADRPVEVGRRGRGDDLMVSEAMMADPAIRFFVERNPDHAQGMALPFIFEIDAGSLASLGWRSIRKALTGRAGRAPTRS